MKKLTPEQRDWIVDAAETLLWASVRLGQSDSAKIGFRKLLNANTEEDDYCPGSGRLKDTIIDALRSEEPFDMKDLSALPEPNEPIVNHSCPECGGEEHDFCKGARLIGQAMDLLEDVPEIGCDYMDGGITNAFNELDDEIGKWRGWCKEAIDNLGKIE